MGLAGTLCDQDRHPCIGAVPVIHVPASLGILPHDMDVPRALMLDAGLLEEGTELAHDLMPMIQSEYFTWGVV